MFNDAMLAILSIFKDIHHNAAFMMFIIFKIIIIIYAKYYESGVYEGCRVSPEKYGNFEMVAKADQAIC